MNANGTHALALPLALVLLLPVAGALAACGAPATPERPQTLTIVLDANPSTGFAWHYALSQTGVVEVVRSE